MEAWLRESPLGFVATHLLYKPLKLTLESLTTVDLLPPKAVALAWWACLAVAVWGLVCPRWGGRAGRGYYAPAAYLLVATMVTAVYAPLARYGVSHVPLWLFYTGAGGADLLARLKRK